MAMRSPLTIFYFAWVRERIGTACETLCPPDDVHDVGALLAWLCRQSPRHAAVLSDTAAIRVAINQDHAHLDAVIPEGAEIAIFPPVTGG